MKAAPITIAFLLLVSAVAPAADAPKRVAFAGGDGGSCERAVVIKGAAGELEGVSSEYRWLSERHPGWSLAQQSLLRSGSRAYDVLDIKTREGETKRVCFDISEFFQP